MSDAKYTLPPLPYGYDALEPAISAQIMTLHHTKHHQTYINNLNAALESQASALQSQNIGTLISLQQKIKFNGGGHINHSLFWENLAPYDSSATDIAKTAPTLKSAIEAQFGSVEDFKKAFNATLLAIQGSGWGWLVSDVSGGKGKLEIVATKDQDPVTGAVPIFGIDMWEHAYYLQYLNNKAGYVEQIWRVVNWEVAERRFKEGVREVAGGLKL
ncbi:superoxide dismutase [Aspergillus undulatus]|uniref:superoxide dismutase n=1 Tax=Aspergillus undulatus TaxID=1810928 RepID=UPI003CCCD87E